MSPDLSRRQLLAALPALALAGCASSASEDSETTTTTDEQTPTASPTATDEPSPTPTPTPDREELIDELPEPSPLESKLAEIFVADDPAAAAEARDVPYSDGAVKVRMELVEDGVVPEQYLVELLSKQDETVIAWVLVEDLVDLATAPDVRIVRGLTPPKTT